jgi:hypothetical protein
LTAHAASKHRIKLKQGDGGDKGEKDELEQGGFRWLRIGMSDANIAAYSLRVRGRGSRLRTARPHVSQPRRI